MTTLRAKHFTNQLLQLANDYNYIPAVGSKAPAHLLGQLPIINKLMIESLDQWFATEGQEFSEEHRQKTALRFCLTLGVGASWFYHHSNTETPDAKELFNLMAAPRSEDAMDEYIEDAVGFSFSSESDKHSQWLALCEYCYSLALALYDLSNAEEREEACLSAMRVGATIGEGLILKHNTKATYQGHFVWDKNIWGNIIPTSKGATIETMLNKWTYMCQKGGFPIEGNIISQPKAVDSFEHHVNCYHQVIFNHDVGIQTIFHISDKEPRAVAIIPHMDSMRTHNLIIDKVYERDNGVEAAISAHFADDPETRITFYDTEYLKNRDQYFAGQYYIFDLYGIGYNVTAVPKFRQQTLATNEKPLHSFIQINALHPEVCRFRAPILATYDDQAISIPAFHEVEVGIPYRNVLRRKKHYFSLFIPTFQAQNKERDFSEGASIEGTIILMGKMRVAVNFHERPCTEVRSFSPLTQRGMPQRFKHKCKAAEVGKEMNADERQAFAKKVMKLFLGEDLEVSFEEDGPDFLASRHRCMWIKSDEEYQAAERFKKENITPALTYYYQTGRLPVMVYVSLYDEAGQPCQWLKGGTYTAQIHYGSMLPGQHMEPRESYDDVLLTQILYEAFKNLHTFPLCKVLHKNLHYTSSNLADPIITREEFLIYLEGVFELNRNSPDDRLRATHCIDETTGLYYIQLTYPEGIIDRLDFEIHEHLITKINITHVKRGKVTNK